MPLWLNVILQVLFIAVIFLVVYNFLKSHVLYKLHPNKWIILLLSIASFIFPPVIAAQFKYNLNGTVLQYVFSAVFLILFLWFIDLKSGAIYNSGKKTQKDIKIKPKAKPGRVNHEKNNKNNKKNKK
jgi:predicted membrane protein